MAASDAIIAVYIWKYGVPVAILGLVMKFKPGMLRMPYKMTYAWVLDKIGRAYNKKMETFKSTLFSSLKDLVKSQGRDLDLLEIGAGSGANFKYYPHRTNVICLDPNPHFESYLQNNHSRFPHVNLKGFVVGYSENMEEVSSDSVDVVVGTLMLCTVGDLQKTLKEIRRVLRPGGKFYFMEHVIADHTTQPWLNRLQRFIEPVWKVVSDGCKFKETWTYLEQAGFSDVQCKKFQAPVARMIRPHIMGTATK